MARGLAARFPATADQPKLFRTMTEAAARAGIPADDLTELTPAAPLIDNGPGATATTPTTPPTDPEGTAGTPTPAPAANARLASQAVGISADGTYDQIQRLLENLEEVERAYLVTGLTLGPAATPGKFTAAITGRMFMMPAAIDPALAPRR
jgi:hypothetical protein